jgi:hypothetical protein
MGKYANSKILTAKGTSERRTLDINIESNEISV